MIGVVEEAAQLAELADEFLKLRAQRRFVEFSRWNHDNAAPDEPVEICIQLGSFKSEGLGEKSFFHCRRHGAEDATANVSARDLLEFILHLLDANLLIDVGGIVGGMG